ncbi:universal stress protein [Gordonia sp. CPCC 206044]|uniref:universal stress protein n=1 Tax=Gordonia sp. CPCC 206044 TaxID=3140793 RepID=UPI003AF3563B
MKLLVAYIATSGGADAVALGVCLARTFHASVDITLVIPPDTASHAADTPDFAELLEEQAHQWLDEARAAVPDDISVQTHITVEENAAHGLIKEVERLRATILVVGGSGGGILVGRHSLGSVVNDLLHSSPVPVALAPSGFRYTGAPRIRELTTAIGRRPGAETLIDTAAQLGTAGDLPLRFLSLVSRDDMPGHRSADDEQHAMESAVTLAQQALDTAGSRLPDNTPITTSIAQGKSIEDAVGTVEWHAGDVIMVGSSRLAAPKRLFLGTTAAKMLRVLAVPMIVVPRHESDA